MAGTSMFQISQCAQLISPMNNSIDILSLFQSLKYRSYGLVVRHLIKVTVKVIYRLKVADDFERCESCSWKRGHRFWGKYKLLI